MAISAAQLEVTIQTKGVNEAAGGLRTLDDAVNQANAGFDALYDSVNSFADNALSALTSVADVLGSIAIMGGVSLLAGGAKQAWSQVDAIQQATFALGAYGDSTEEVNAALQDLTRYAEDASRSGGIFWSQDLYKAAQTLVTLGDDLDAVSEHVQIMSRSVGLGLSNWEELSRVIGRVGSTGRLTTVEFDLLRQAGFRLDESLRNTNITWDELFAALDKGIPAEALLGQANTIQGALLYLKGAVIDLGQAFLGVGDDMQFIAGGLGDRIFSALQGAPEMLERLAPAISAFGTAIAGMLGTLSNLMDMFASLPSSVQAVATGLLGLATAFGAIRMAIRGAGLMTGLAGIGGVFGQLQMVTTGAMSLGGALRGVVMSLNPLMLGFGALAIGAGVLWGKFREGKEAAENLDKSLQSLVQTEKDLRLDHEDAAAASVKLFRKQSEGIADLADSYYHSERLWNDAVQISIETGRTQGDVLQELREEYSRTADEANAFAEAQTTIGNAFQDSRIDHAALLDDLTKFHEQYIAGELTLDEYDAKIIDASQNLDRYRVETEDATEATRGLGEAFDLVKDKASGLIDELTHINDVTEDDSFWEKVMKTLGLDASQRGQLDAIADNITGGFTPFTEMPGPGATQQEWLDWVNESGLSELEHARRIEVANDARRKESALIQLGTQDLGEYTDRIRQSNAALAALGELVLQDALGTWNLSGHASAASALAESITNVTAALESNYRIVVANTDAIGDQMQQLDDWATGLIGIKGEYSELDKLLAEGRITIDQYNAAQEAQIQIMDANAQVQRDLLAIQAQQAPILADNAEATAEYIRQLREMNDGTREGAQAQLAALAWMDDATTSWAMEFLELGTMLVGLGPKGQASLQQIVDGIVATDPARTALLEDMGLIEQQMDGSYELNIDGFEDANNDIRELTKSIDALTEALGGTPPLHLDVEGREDLDAATRDIAALPDRKDVTVSLTTSADGFINRVLGSGGEAPAASVPIDLDVNDAALDALRNQPPVVVPVMLDIGGAAGGTVAGAAQSALDQHQQSMTVSFTADTSDLDAAIANLDTITIPDKTLKIWGDATFALAAIDNVNLAAVHDKTLTIWGNALFALSAVENVNNAAVYDKTLTIYGDATFALAAVENVNAAVVHDKYMTIHVNKVADVSSHATGGLVQSDFQIVGEQGPELVSLPRRSYVHTAAETRGMIRGFGGGAGGGDVHIAKGAVVNHIEVSGADVDEERIAQLAGERTMTAIQHLAGEKRRGTGLNA